MIYLVIHFICALVSFWLFIRWTYRENGTLTKFDFISTLCLSTLLGPFFLGLLIVRFVVQYVEDHGHEEFHVLDKFFKGDKDGV